MDRLAGKVALVFGAGPNIGGTIAHFMAREGAAVAVMDSDAAQAERTRSFLAGRGHQAFAVTGNASQEEEISRAVDATVAHFGGLDIAVNLAAVMREHPLDELTLDDWNLQIAESLTPGMLTTKYAARAMTKLGSRGSIIHGLSTGAHYGHAGRPGYTAVKAGLLNMARTAAMEVAHLGIRVNTITPIGMENNIWDESLRSFGIPKSRYTYTIEDVLQSIPLGRLPRASDIAWAAVFLASEESSFITATDIAVDGGTRYKYPIWRPGNFSGITLAEYKKTLKITEYGEPVRDYDEPSDAPGEAR